jgi:hypothetical protein
MPSPPFSSERSLAAEIERRVGVSPLLAARLAAHVGQMIAELPAFAAVAMSPTLDENTAAQAARDFLAGVEAAPYRDYDGRGVVICAGGVRLLRAAWVCVNMLRHYGCRLPIELWQLDAAEIDAPTRSRFEELGVSCVDASHVRSAHPARILRGWELKPYALLHSRFREILLLDADNVPLVNPEYLFDALEYRRSGAVFWPDAEEFPAEHAIWRICGLPAQSARQCESGQVLVDKVRHWRPLRLTMHLNEHSDFYYRHVHGDKDTYQLAWRIAGSSFSLVPHPMYPLLGTMCQHDFANRRIFQHRSVFKWDPGKHIEGFLEEERCLRFVDAFDAGLPT